LAGSALCAAAGERVSPGDGAFETAEPRMWAIAKSGK
jgi:hypothetical protein